MPRHCMANGFASLFLVLVAIGPALGDEKNSAGRIAKALEATTEFHFHETPLSDAIALLKSQLKVNLIIDSLALTEAGIDIETPVSIHLKQVQYRTGLELLLRGLELTYQIEDDVLVVTTPEGAEQRLTTTVYDVKNLIGDGGSDVLIETITSLISLEDWDDLGGPGTIRGFDGALIVSQTARTHNRIAKLLDELRGFLAGKAQTPSDLQRLFDNARVELKFSNKPLNAMMEQVAAAVGADAFVDAVALQDVGLSPDLAMTVELTGKDALSTLLDSLAQHSLTVRCEGNVLVVMRIADAEKQLPIVIYDVRDLVGKPGADEATYEYDSLLEMVLGSVAVDSWDDVGGPGSVVAFRGALVIGQSDACHLQVSDLLKQLRHAGEPTPSSAEKALRSRTTLKLVDAPLIDALKLLSERHNIIIQIDRLACREINVDVASLVNCELSETRLSSALTIMLRPLRLTFVPRDDRIIVTSQEMSENLLMTRVYRIEEHASAGKAADAKELAELIASSIAQESWDIVGGPGSVQSYRNLVVISQTYAVHTQVESLLAQLKHLHRARAADKN